MFFQSARGGTLLYARSAAPQVAQPLRVGTIIDRFPAKLYEGKWFLIRKRYAI
jgi:hypothetical protein